MKFSGFVAKLDQTPQSVLKYAAGLAGVYAAIQTTNFMWKYYLKPVPNLRTKYAGSWAVVSGGSGGIGLGIAEELAASGINIVLLARNADRLKCTAEDIKSRYPGIETRIVSIDAESAQVESAMKVIRGLNVSLLVNNVGVHNEVPANTEDLSAADVRRMINVNCTFQVLITSAVIPQLKEFARQKSAKQGKPMVVNVSSLTSKMAMPLLSVYAATKAFEEHWTEGLGAELEPSGVEVICLRPGLTVSQMSGQTEPSLFCPSAQTMARACLRMLNSGEVSVAPYAPHALLDWVNGWVPRRVTWSIVRDMHLQKRAECLRKHSSQVEAGENNKK